MIHYTCDRCKRSINPETDVRYVVEIEVRLASVVAPEPEPVDDLDQLAELHDQLQREVTADELADAGFGVVDLEKSGADETAAEEGPDQYDLCEQCHEVFANNPLGREVAVGFGFSNN